MSRNPVEQLSAECRDFPDQMFVDQLALVGLEYVFGELFADCPLAQVLFPLSHIFELLRSVGPELKYVLDRHIRERIGSARSMRSSCFGSECLGYACEFLVYLRGYFITTEPCVRASDYFVEFGQGSIELFVYY